MYRFKIEMPLGQMLHKRKKQIGKDGMLRVEMDYNRPYTVKKGRKLLGLASKLPQR
jgi:hypothetical protein